MLDIVTRRRKKKEIYIVTLYQAESEETQAFHIAFSIFISTRIYYENNLLQFYISKSQSITLKLCRDYLLSKSRFYYNMLKYFYAEGFKQIL